MMNVVLGILAIANLLIAFNYAIDKDVARTIIHCAIFMCLMLY